MGIIGTSLGGYDDTGGKSTPMVNSGEQDNVWETTLYLKKGTVKFRCRDSWTQNWGGTDFPTGKTLSDGPNIPVPDAGWYRIVLNLNNGTYSFSEVEENSILD